MDLSKRFERFCHRHRNWGIPNLMLYICIGAGLVTVMALLGYTQLYYMLNFDRALILKGQVWRLVSYVFLIPFDNFFLMLISIYCMVSIGRAVESYWGTFKFNLYYLIGIILMDVYAMCFEPMLFVYDFNRQASQWIIGGYPGFYSAFMSSYLHLCLIMCYATLCPDAQFVLFFIIPIRARLLALIYLAYTLFQVIQLSFPVLYFPCNLFPLVILLNYFLLFREDVLNLIPPSWRKKKASKTQTSFRSTMRKETSRQNKQEPLYLHRCTVCGRTSTSNPELEFRYCSQCSGYHCYCIDHINDHPHIH